MDKWDKDEKRKDKAWKDQGLPIRPLLIPFYVGFLVGAVFSFGLFGMIFRLW